MWECPACGRQYANVNQWHSCGKLGLEETLAQHDERIVEIYRSIETSLAASGVFRVHPQKTRIAFVSRMTFVSVHLAARWADLAFIVVRPIDDSRIRRIELFGPATFRHRLRLLAVDDLDETVREWLVEALRRGDMAPGDATVRVEPVVGRSLEILSVPLRATVSLHDTGLALAVPRYVTDAFAAHRYVRVRMGGTLRTGRLHDGSDGSHLVLDGEHLEDNGSSRTPDSAWGTPSM